MYEVNSNICIFNIDSKYYHKPYLSTLKIVKVIIFIILSIFQIKRSIFDVK